MSARFVFAVFVMGLAYLYIFEAWFSRAVDKAISGCDHKYLDDTVPFSDMSGGWHHCVHCQKRKYIRWGFQYQRLKVHGHIAEDKAHEDMLMDKYTGFSILSKTNPRV